MFTWPVRVYYEDIDIGGVVYHANYLKFMERARSEWLRALGFDQTVLRERDGLLLVVISADIQYLKPARFEEMLCVTAEFETGRRTVMTFRQSIYRESTEGERLISARVRAACVREGSFRPTALPEGIIEAMERFE